MSDLKGVILCAGEAQRLRPISYAAPKALFPVANRPLIGYALQALTAVGVTDIGIVISPTHGATRDAIGDGAAWGARVMYIKQQQARGLGDAVAQAAEFVGDSPFLLYLGDTLMDQGIGPVVDAFERDECDAQMLLAEVAKPCRFGVAEVDGRRVVRLIEKPKQPPSNLAVVGVYAFQPCIFEAIGRTELSGRGELEITDAIQTMIDSGRTVCWLRLDGWWGDVGSPESALATNAHLLQSLNYDVKGDIGDDCTVEGRVSVGRGSVVRRGTLRGPVCIGENCRIEDATIGPDVCLGDRTCVRRSKISNTIVEAECSICDVGGGITNSVFGERARVTGVGDGCSVVRTRLCADSELCLARRGADT